jgi:hypothetical protein
LARRSRFTAALIAIVAPAATAPVEAGAQMSLSLDGGWSTVHYDEYLRASVYALSPTLRLEYPRSVVAARGTLSLFESGSRSADLSIAASTFSRAYGLFRMEISGGGGGSVYNGFGTGHFSLGARLHALGRNGGAWVGGTGGYVDDGIIPSALGRYSAGAWTRLGNFSLSGAVMHQATELLSATDFEVGGRFARGGFTLNASAGARSGGRDLIGARQWGEVSTSFWFNRHVAVVAAHGRYPSEPGRGMPGGSYTTVSMRLATRPSVAEAAAMLPDRGATPAIARPIVAGFQLRRNGDSTVSIVVRSPGARRIEVAGDFNLWEPTELVRAQTGDNFTFKLKLSPGSYKFVLRVDAGEWGVPPGVPVMLDDFGNAVALLIIQ